MPGFNQKGPEGEGPMTGRRMGRCTNYGARSVKNREDQSPDSVEPAADRGMGRGMRGGRGFGRGPGMGKKGGNRFRNGG